MKPCLIVYIFLSLLVMPACSQSFDWWKNLVSWDGISSWKEYIRYNPRYLGPNALPVPFIGNGSIDSISSFSITGNFHTTKGDQTINPTLYANYNIVKDRISIDAFLVPIERYNVSHKLKEERNVYYLNYYDKAATGDLHLNMNIQLLNKIRNKIHLSLRLGFRYASSEKIAAARFTDAPGYFFDLSAGKKLGVSSN